MNSSRVFLLTLILASCSAASPPSFPASEATGLRENESVLSGRNYVFALTSPPNWIADSEAGRGAGVDTVFYPSGSSWNGPVSFYPRVWQKNPGDTVATVIAADLAQYQMASPDVEMMERPAIPISVSATGQLRLYRSQAHGLREAVAYIDQSQTVVLLVLRAKDDTVFERSLQSFEEFVRSYRPLEIGRS
jgi:hypothetical protein